MGAAAVRGAVPLGAHLPVVVNHGVEDGGEHSAMLAVLVSEAIEHELGDRCIPDQLGPTQDLKVAGDGGLGQLQHRLQVGDEEGRGSEAVEDPEPGRLGNRQQEVGGRGGFHMRVNEYILRHMDARAGGWPALPS